MKSWSDKSIYATLKYTHRCVVLFKSIKERTDNQTSLYMRRLNNACKTIGFEKREK